MARRGDVLEPATTRPPRAKKPIPFAFVLEALEGLGVTTRPMFGCTAIYVGPRIVLTLRRRGDADDGVWIATSVAHHTSLRAELPSLRTIAIFGQAVSSWQNLPADGAHFEEEVARVCALVRAGDVRVGKVPDAARKPKAPRVSDDEASGDTGAELRLPRKRMVHPEALGAAKPKRKKKATKP